MKKAISALVLLCFSMVHAQEHLGYRWTYRSQVTVTFDILNTRLAAPSFIRLPYPEYPFEMIRAGLQGVVKLSCVVAKDGGVKDIAVSTPSGKAALDDAAVTALRTWRFHPFGQKLPGGLVANNYADEVKLTVSIQFALPEG